MHDRKFRQPCLLLLLLLLCLTACAPPWPEESSAEGSRDPFEESSEIVMDNRRTHASIGCILDKTAFSPRENDVYEAVYTGEVLRIPYTFLAEGMKEGLGFVVFLDGQAQPYYTGRDATERYCHVFHPEDNKLYSEEIFLQPVTGRRGEELQLLICNIWDPEFIPHPDTHPEEMSYSPAIGVRCHRMSLVIRFEADAAASPTAETADAAANRVSVQWEDLKEVEITGWSSEQLANEIEHGHAVYGVSDKSAFFLVLLNDLPSILAAIAVCAVLAAVMSTISGMYTSFSVTIVKDIYHDIINPKAGDKQLKVISLILSVITTVCCVLIALYADSIINLLCATYVFIGAACLIPFLGGIVWKKGNAKGAIASSIVGVLVCILDMVGVFKPTYESLFPLIPALVAYVVVSLLTQNKTKAVEAK